MTDNEKLTMLKAFLQITDDSQDMLLSTYLTFAKNEILSWLYQGNIPAEITDVPRQYENVQIMACVAGFNLIGAENESSHSENGITRQFKYSDMVDYIRSHVFAYAVVR